MKTLVMESAGRVYERDIEDLNEELNSILGGNVAITKIDLGLKYIIGICYNTEASGKEISLVKPEIEALIHGSIVFIGIRGSIVVNLDNAGLETIYSNIIPQ